MDKDILCNKKQKVKWELNVANQEYINDSLFPVIHFEFTLNNYNFSLNLLVL